jgi:hypothetical protein
MKERELFPESCMERIEIGLAMPGTGPVGWGWWLDQAHGHEGSVRERGKETINQASRPISTGPLALRSAYTPSLSTR